MSGKENVINILMRRDGLSRDEAKELYREARTELYEALNDEFIDPDDVIMDVLGLEPDYLFDLL